GLTLAERLIVVEADIDGDHDLRRKADEPGAAEIIGGAGLAADRPAEDRSGRAGPPDHHALEHGVYRIGGDRFDQLFTRRLDIGAIVAREGGVAGKAPTL